MYGFLSSDLENKFEKSYYCVSTAKLVFLTLIIIGAFSYYWFFKNFRILFGVHSYKPYLLTLFSPIFSVIIFSDVNRSAKKHLGGFAIPAKLLSVVFLLINLSWNLPAPYFLIGGFAFLPILPINFAALKMSRI